MRPIILVIMDGIGVNPDSTGNAVAQANTPILDKLISTYPSTQIGASGMHVGLPDGQMGNSEVGHLNIGAGRIVYQNFTRISKAISSGEFSKNPEILKIIDKTNKSGKALHLMGLLSDGGVHSHMDHLFALIDLAEKRGIENLFIHPFMDGRDTPPRSGRGYIEELEKYLEKKGTGKIATIMGRFYAMDRDNRWDRVRLAFETMTNGGERKASSAAEAIERSYEEDNGDEFILPTLINSEGLIGDGDNIIFFNFRADRAREITRAFTEKKFNSFGEIDRPNLGTYLCLTEYDSDFGLPLAFPPTPLNNTLGQLVSRAGMKQLRIAETEKYAHVTFFFNGGVEKENKGEERILIPSPKDVRTYDEKPSMSASEVTDRVVEALEGRQYDLIVLNYANGDMVGHTGAFEAALEAVETVDSCIGRLFDAAKVGNYRVLITADHGNADQMINPKTGQPHTAHSTNPVHFIVADDSMINRKLRSGGILADIAPTILDLFAMEKPVDMDGSSLIIPN